MEIRASELGGCTKMLVLKGLGYEAMDTPAEAQAWFDAGKAAEEEVVEKLRADGEVVLDRQREVRLEFGNSQVVGHLDGVMGGRVLEIKSMSDAEFKKFEARRWDTSGLVQKYKWQISVYMLGSGLEALVLVYNRDTGQILRLGVELPFYGVKEIEQRVLSIEDQVAVSKVPTKCDISNYPCPYFYLHEDEEVEVDDELEGDARRYLDLRKQEQDVKRGLDAVRARLIRGMDGRSKVKTGSAALNLAHVVNRRFNVDKARKDGVDVDRYMEESSFERLTVKSEK